MLASVHLQSVSKSYGSASVIADLDIRIDDNSFVVLVGPSGCGKSTILRMVAGLEPISGGSILIDERQVNDVPPKDRDIAMVFQNYALYPHMTVRENLAFSLRLRKIASGEISESIDKASAILGIDKLLDRYPRQLSGGQKQRVAMGRAIVRDPKVFLFDEPLSNLDAKLRVQMRGDIRAIQRRLNTTTLYVTHDQVEAMTMADKVVVLRDGVVEQIGTPMEIYDTPRNRFVAEFIGSPQMNVVPATVVEAGIRIASDTILPIPGLGSEIGKSVWCGVRPEHVEIADSPIILQVETVENTGTDTFVVGRLDGTEFAVLSRKRLSVHPGDVMPIRIATDRVHLFDRDSELRIPTIPVLRRVKLKSIFVS
jgi:multiple sugar transport system ATP-binding protein